MATASGGWSEAPIDVLWKIIERLPVSDYVRFGAVCVSWRSALAERRRRPAIQAPWLLLPGDDTDPTSTSRFLSLPERREYRMDLPAIRGRRCIGSSDGWLVWADDTAELHMFDPMSGACVDLPSITTLPDVKGVSRDSDGRINGYIYHLPVTRPPEFYGLDYMRSLYITKVIVSPGSTPGSYLAAAIYTWPEKLAFARAGDEFWTPIPMLDSGFVDIIFHNELLYAVNYLGNVFACDFSDPSNPRVAPMGTASDTRDYPKYLVMSAGVLLQVWRKVRYFPTDEERAAGQSGLNITTLFTVFRMDPISNKWVEVNNLGDQALFLGHNCSVSLSARNLPEVRGNCIYFTDDSRDDYLPPPQRRDLGVYHMEDGSLEPYYPPDAKPNWPPPIWFTPNSKA